MNARQPSLPEEVYGARATGAESLVATLRVVGVVEHEAEAFQLVERQEALAGRGPEAVHLAVGVGAPGPEVPQLRLGHHDGEHRQGAITVRKHHRPSRTRELRPLRSRFQITDDGRSVAHEIAIPSPSPLAVHDRPSSQRALDRAADPFGDAAAVATTESPPVPWPPAFIPGSRQVAIRCGASEWYVAHEFAVAAHGWEPTLPSQTRCTRAPFTESTNAGTTR